MARWTDIADWVGPSPNDYPGGEQSPVWVVLHIQEGTEAGTVAWQRNPASQVSSHFLAPKSGRLAQMLDTADASWSVVNGNRRALSIECEGRSGDALTADQIESCAQVLARAHSLYGIPLTAVAPPASGLTGHGLGGAGWGGHFDCPGSPILNQRPAIIARASQILGGSTPAPLPTTTPTTTEDDMPVFATGEIPQDTGAHMVLVPPPNLPNGLWGDVRFSLGCDFVDGLTVRCAAWIDGVGWDIKTVAVPREGDRVNPWGGPLPKGAQKISVVRSTAAGTVGWLVEAAHR
jgi:hypothetical protein